MGQALPLCGKGSTSDPTTHNRFFGLCTWMPGASRAGTSVDCSEGGAHGEQKNDRAQDPDQCWL